MPRPKNVLVESYGMIYSLTPKQYTTLLQTVRDGNSFNLSQHGKYIGIITANVSDLDETQAKMLLGEDEE